MNITYRFDDKHTLHEIAKCYGCNVSHDSNTKMLSFNAFIDSEPIGTIAFLKSHFNTIIVSYLFVVKMFQKMGIGNNLINRTLDWTKAQQINIITFDINDSDYNIENISTFLKKFNFKTQYRYTLYRIKCEDVINNFIKKFFNKISLNNHNEYQFCLVNQLSKNQIIELNKRSDTVGFGDLIPENSGNFIQPQLSAVIIKNKYIVGWCVTQQNRQNELAVRHTYVDDLERNTAMGLMLWNFIFSTTNQQELIQKYKFISFVFDKTDKKLYKLYNMLFLNSLYKKVEYYRATINLNT